MSKQFSLVYLKCYLVILICIYLSLQLYLMTKRTAAEMKTILSHESYLCGNSSKKWVKYSRRNCPKRGITTFVEGTLSNHMWQYANVLAVSLALELEGYVPTCLKNSLERMFSNLSMPVLADVAHCDILLQEEVEPIEDWKDSDQFRAISSTALYKEIINKHVDAIRRHFVFTKKLSERASAILHGVLGDGGDVTSVGVLISKKKDTSFIKNSNQPDVQFILAAMDKFREDYKNSYFIVIAADDGMWNKVFGEKDVYVIEGPHFTEPKIAMAVLSRCSHSIILDNDLGIWGAILSGGDAIVSFSLNEEMNSLMKLRDNWKYLISDKP